MLTKMIIEHDGSYFNTGGRREIRWRLTAKAVN
jgi:hypothetical protein